MAAPTGSPYHPAKTTIKEYGALRRTVYAALIGTWLTRLTGGGSAAS